MTRKEIFVYAVCGSREHTDALNLSIRYLQHFTRNEILVVTDTSRNEAPILHRNILDYKTPSRFSNKEAGIFLKTRLPEILPVGNIYCYLDTDVITADERAGEIFSHFSPPVTFVSDHCPMDEFSPGCVKCDCRMKFRQLSSAYRDLELKYIEKYIPKEPGKRKRYDALMELMKSYGSKTPLAQKFPSLKQIMAYILPNPYNFEIWLRHNGDYVWDGKKRQIFDKDGTLLYDDAEPYPEFRKFIESRSSFDMNGCRQYMNSENKFRYFYMEQCTHLHDAIKDRFNVQVAEKKWSHWNGGVFVFEDSARKFFDTWHRFTLEIFDDPYWEKRDQGTLIAAVWRTGLQNHSRLPEIFNFIADYDSEYLRFDEVKGFSRDNFATSIKPAFVHIYHHFGDKSWPVWQWVEKLL